MYTSRHTPYFSPYHANMIATNIDYNWDGIIQRKELKFDWGAKKYADYNRDGTITKHELAHSIHRGDIFITNDRRAHRGMNTYNQSPWGNNPGYGRNPYHSPYPSGGYYSNSGQVLGTTIVGAGIGAGVGYAVGGSDGAGTGAVVGGVLGFISNLFD